MYKSLRLSVIATLLLATTALTIISYNILNPKPLPEPPVVAVPEPPVALRAALYAVLAVALARVAGLTVKLLAAFTVNA